MPYQLDDRDTNEMILVLSEHSIKLRAADKRAINAELKRREAFEQLTVGFPIKSVCRHCHAVNMGSGTAHAKGTECETARAFQALRAQEAK